MHSGTVRTLATTVTRVRDPELAQIELSLLKTQLAAPDRSQPLGVYPDLEIRMLASLVPMLRHRTGIDIGAERGDYTQFFCDMGLEVLSIEASPVQVQSLRRRFAGHENVRVLHAAMSDGDGVARLHLAERLQPDGYGDGAYNSVIGDAVPGALDFPASIAVPRRTLSSLVAGGLLSPEIGVLKIDTEGYDLSVLVGAWPHIGEVTILEYWSRDFAMSRPSTPNDISDYNAFFAGKPDRLDMLAIARDENSRDLRFQINPRASLPNSWGNVILFRREDMMLNAVRWCVDMLSTDRLRF